MIDKRGITRSEGRHHPPRAVTRRRGRPVQGGTPPDWHEQIYREEGSGQEKPYICTKCKYRASTPWNFWEHQERYRTSKEPICEIFKTFKWRRAAGDHMKKILLYISMMWSESENCGRPKAHSHDTGKRQAPEESEELKRLEGHHNEAHQGTQRVATGRQDQAQPRATQNQNQNESLHKTNCCNVLSDCC